MTRVRSEEFRELGRQIHDVRKSGLYFDPTAATLSGEAVSGDEAAAVIKLAESRLGMETAKRWVPAGSQQAESVRWFGGVTTDPKLREFVFGGASLKKLSELPDVPQWIRWLREQVEEADRRAEQACGCRKLRRGGAGVVRFESGGWPGSVSDRGGSGRAHRSLVVLLVAPATPRAARTPVSL